MSYATVQTAVANVIKKRSGYKRNVSENDYKVFSRGFAKVVILRRGPASSTRESISGAGTFTIINRWTVNIEIWAPFRKDIANTRNNLNTYLDEVSGELQKWPYLDAAANVLHHDTGTALEPEEFSVTGFQGNWWRQVMPLVVLEQETVTASE